MLQFFNFDSLAIIATALILFIVAIVLRYSANYLRGNNKRSQFIFLVFSIAGSLIVTFSADNIFLFWTFWTLSNVILVLLMIHKTSWKQAVSSGMMAFKNFFIGSLSLFIALTTLYLKSGETSISDIVSSQIIEDQILIICSVLILITALTQSAIYPFHSWLISSLNSPTPASAIMHAGLVNGGGILLARFAPIFLKLPEMMTIIFIIGVFSAILGTMWKLIQSNVKSMLACSTLSQMGFMIAQCAMGLFPAAIAHLFWHGMFKSYLFLSSPGSWNEKRLDPKYPPEISSFLLSLLCGIVGAQIFAKISGFEITTLDTTLVLIAICFIAASQVALVIIGKSPIKNFVPALILSSFVSALYSASVTFVEKIAAPEIFQPQPLNIFHLIAIALFFLMWLLHLFLRKSEIINSRFFAKYYVKFLNASQPKSTTITANRNQYNYR